MLNFFILWLKIKNEATRLFICFVDHSIPFSCSSDDADQSIDDYLKGQQPTAQKQKNGLYYIIDVPGNDTPTKVNSTVRVKSTKKGLLNGDVLIKSDDFKNEPLQRNSGWRRGHGLIWRRWQGYTDHTAQSRFMVVRRLGPFLPISADLLMLNCLRSLKAVS